MFPDVFPMRAIESAWEPALDFSETEKEYLVRLEVPGFHRENLDVKFDAGLLTISGHRELQSEAKGEEYLWQERQAGRFARTLRLPAPVAGDKDRGGLRERHAGRAPAEARTRDDLPDRHQVASRR
jgi:HSP20 family protein